MATKIEGCAEQLFNEVNGEALDDISDENHRKLIRAFQCSIGEDVTYECPVPECTVRFTARAIAGKLTVLASDIKVSEQPCAE